MRELHRFPGSGDADITALGGKGASLVRLQLAGLRVPPGAILTTAFFEPWFAALRATPAWQALLDAEPAGWAQAGDAIKAQVPSLALTEHQISVLAALDDSLDGELFAVRSSSPEEDLETASFAGGYETRLGVARSHLEPAIRACFASSLDARVMHYKAEHGFDPFAPRIAVVVQQQLDSRVAGAAFSLNPLNNDYDEAVIDACWGLGETVVAGLTSPDHFVVHKPDGAILEQRIGAKERSLWLRPDGGSEERTGHRSDEPCLSAAELAELTDVVQRVEDLFGSPVDIEWAWADDRLHVLQARPVTAYVPLPPELTTRPGERRVLWMDASLSNGLTLNVPVSPLGLDWLTEVFLTLLERFAGPLDRDTPADEALYRNEGGRLYANLSHLLWVNSPEQLQRGNKSVDALMAAILGNIDKQRYRSAKRPPSLGLRGLTRLPRVVWSARRVVWRLTTALLMPERSLRRYQADTAAVERKIRELDASGRFEVLLYEGFDALVDTGFAALWSALGAYGIGLMAVERLATPVDRELAMRMQQGFEGNVVVEMGVELHRLAGMVAADLDDVDDLAARIEARRMPPAFLDAWDAFNERFGHRGPIEMDLASPRYADDPRLALSQMAAIAAGPRTDPAQTTTQLVAQRADAYAQLAAKCGAVRRLLLRLPNALLHRFAGARDTPKHLLTLYNYALRRCALAEGQTLVEAGRLDAPEHIFDLHLDQLPGLRADPSLDLRALRRDNIAFISRLREARVVFPPVIDSRGRILRPPPADEEPGELRGMGVSPGVARGRVRLLHAPDAAAIEPGEVLVAYTTDPGWTPLFINAAAVVLEIGGTLQHGALVAREYGKPCVVAVSRVLERLQDGQLVEVDGTDGVVRLLDGS